MPTTRDWSIVARVVLLASLVVLAALTHFVQVRDRTLRRQIGEVEQVLDVARRMQLAFAHEMSALHGFALTRDEEFLRSFERSRADGERSLATLARMAPESNAAIANRVMHLQELSRQWHETVPRVDLAPADRMQPVLLDPAEIEQGRYNALIAEAATVQRLFRDEESQLRQRIDAVQTLDWRATLVLTFLALATGIVILWLGRRVDLLARESERRREELEELIVERSRLIRGLSHDIKNPLSAVLGYAELLEEGVVGQLEPRQQDMVKNIHRAGGSALDILDDLVALAHSRTDTLRIEKEVVDVVPLLEDAAADFKIQADRAGLEFQAQLPPGPVSITTDPGRVRQILGNLLANAIKYTPPPGIVVFGATVRHADTASGTGLWLAVEVRDSGPGIAEDQRERIFEEFFRVVEGRQVKGLGLGLPMSRQAARLLGGDITVASAPEKGAMFTLWLPLAEADTTPVNSPAD